MSFNEMLPSFIMNHKQLPQCVQATTNIVTKKKNIQNIDKVPLESSNEPVYKCEIIFSQGERTPQGNIPHI